MLFQTVHFPGAYRLPSTPEGYIEDELSHLITVLQGAVKNCVILADESIRDELREALSPWPQQYRKPAYELLSQLRSRNRFVFVPSRGHSDAPSCGARGCQRAFALSEYPDIDMVLVARVCPHCHSLQRAVGASQYAVSDFNRKRDDCVVKHLACGEWSKDDFEQKVWKPIFRHAQSIALVDRWVGRSLLRDQNCTSIPRNYRRGVQWILDQIAQHNSSVMPTVELYCGLDSQDAHRIAMATRLLKTWREELADRYREQFQFGLYVKKETREHQLEHDRYVITDQIGLAIGRGLDILCDNNLTLRDTTISVLPMPGQLVTEVRILPDLL